MARFFAPEMECVEPAACCDNTVSSAFALELLRLALAERREAWRSADAAARQELEARGRALASDIVALEGILGRGGMAA